MDRSREHSSMYKVLIIGAGSIGNHLSYACRMKGWSVDLYDIDPVALRRTREQIYPSRYGAWDDQITLLSKKNFDNEYDLAIVGTPPATHLQIATNLLASTRLRVMLIEKPLCTPNLDGLQQLMTALDANPCKVLLGYNHIFTKNTARAEEILLEAPLGAVLSIHVRWLEHWGGIFAAHPWLAGPSDSYLGSWGKGGGSCGEHSHAISLWQHFSEKIGCGQIRQVTSTMDMIESEVVNYDQTSQLLVQTANGLVGSILQDVVTKPAEKMMRIQFENGFLEWQANFDSQHDAVRYSWNGLSERLEMI